MMMLMLAACLPLAADSDRITAADLAVAEAGFSAIPPDTPLGYAPAPGVKRTFGFAELSRLARRYSLTLASHAEICIERPVEPLSSAAVLDAMRGSLGLADARLEIIECSRYPVPRGLLEFPRGSLQAPPPAQKQAAALWKGFIRYGGNRRFAVWARVRVGVKMNRVVANQALPAGRAIDASQLRLDAYEGFPLPTPPLDALEQAVGRMPKRSLPAGAALAPGDLESPYDVKRGDSVRVAVVKGEAHLELEGRAEAPGRRGQTIPVLNPATGRKFSARVEGAGRVEVGTHP